MESNRLQPCVRCSDCTPCRHSSVGNRSVRTHCASHHEPPECACAYWLAAMRAVATCIFRLPPNVDLKPRSTLFCSLAPVYWTWCVQRGFYPDTIPRLYPNLRLRHSLIEFLIRAHMRVPECGRCGILCVPDSWVRGSHFPLCVQCLSSMCTPACVA